MAKPSYHAGVGAIYRNPGSRNGGCETPEDALHRSIVVTMQSRANAETENFPKNRARGGQCRQQHQKLHRKRSWRPCKNEHNVYPASPVFAGP